MSLKLPESFIKDPFHHVVDHFHFDVFDSLSGAYYHVPVPFGISRFQFAMGLAALLVCALFIPYALAIRNGRLPRGRIANALEFLLLFVRDQIAKPTIGEHDYKKYLPFLWTLFLFLLFTNLLGVLPFVGTATASIWVTGVLALISFFVIHLSGIAVNGVGGYAKSFMPHVEANDALTKILAPVIQVGLVFLEVLSAFIRAVVLAVRLFANMLAGHTVLFVLLFFIQLVGQPGVGDRSLGGLSAESSSLFFWPVTLMSVLLSVFMSVLELFVACLQAFVFTFLTSTFIGLARHPEH